MSSPQKISQTPHFAKTFSICTLVTRPQQYQDMLDSAKAMNFGDDCEFLYFDNTHQNGVDGYRAVNLCQQQAVGEYVVLCHQDVVFLEDKNKLLACLQALDTKDPLWAVAGNAGKDGLGRLAIRITDPSMPDIRLGDLPARVLSLDENFMVFNQKNRVAASVGHLTGFHLYGLDVCQNAHALGLSCYVIDYHLHHKSSGNIDKSYALCQENYTRMHQKRLAVRDFFAVCGHFFVGRSAFLNTLINRKFFLKMRRSWLKRLNWVKS